MMQNIYVGIVIVLSLMSSVLAFMLGLEAFNGGFTWLALAIWSLAVSLVIISYHYYRYEWNYYKKLKGE